MSFVDVIRKVIIAFDHHNPENVGQTVELPEAEARSKVFEGRARFADTHPDHANNHLAEPLPPADEDTPDPVSDPTPGAVAEDTKPARQRGPKPATDATPPVADGATA